MNYKLPKSIQIAVLGLITAIGLSGTASATQFNWGVESGAKNITYADASLRAGSFLDTFSFSTLSSSSFSTSLNALNAGSWFNLSGLTATLYSGTFAHPGAALESSHSPAGASFASLSPITLGAGSYFLQISGKYSGKFGGAYLGSANLSPVPEADVWALFLGGLAFMGFVIFRKSKKQLSNSGALIQA